MPLIPRQSPNLVLDVVVVSCDRRRPFAVRDDKGQPTGELQDRGRELIVQTAGGQLIVVVRIENDEEQFAPGAHELLNIELAQGEMEGRAWEQFVYVSRVDPGQVDSWHSALRAQSKAAATA